MNWTLPTSRVSWNVRSVEFAACVAMRVKEEEMSQDERTRVRRWRELLNSERDAAALYTRLAAAEAGERREIFEKLAAIERRHASHWCHSCGQGSRQLRP